MNYIAQINAFWDWKLSHSMSHREFRLYFTILHIVNRSKWMSNVSIPNTTLISLFGLTSNSQLAEVRMKLINSGLITYKKNGRTKPGEYTVVKLYSGRAQDGADNFFYDVSGTKDGTENGIKNGTKISTKDSTKDSTANSTFYKKEKREKRNDTKRNIPPLSPQGERDEVLEGVEDDKLRDALFSFCQMRDRLKKPVTAQAIELLIKKLGTMTPDISEQVKIVEQSVMNGWQGLYPLEGKKVPGDSAQDENGMPKTNNVFMRLAMKQNMI